jgi:prepilin-type N-terminal cleavage/methylation domain-containing protein
MKNQKGFTLIELIIATALVAVAVGVMVSLYGPVGGNNQVIDLPPGQTLDQVFTLYPLAYTTRLRVGDEPINQKTLREPGRFWDTVVVFRER